MADAIDFQPLQTNESGGGGIDFQPIGIDFKKSPIQKLNPTNPLKGVVSTDGMEFGYGKELRDLGKVVDSAFGTVGDAVLGFFNLPYNLGASKFPVTRENFMPQEGVEMLLNDLVGNKSLPPKDSGVPNLGALVPPSVTHFLARGAHEFITPENLGTGAALGAAQLPANVLKGIGIAFGVPLLAQVPKDVKAKDTEGAILHSIAGALPVLGATIPERVAPKLASEDITSQLKLKDLDEAAGRVPPERQLPGPRGEFVATPRGDIIDFQQLSPAEQTEFMRGPRVYQEPPPPTPKQPLLLKAPDEPLQMGPTTLKQTLDNARRLLEEAPKPVRENAPKGTADYMFSGLGVVPDFERYQDLVGQIREAIANKDFAKVFPLQQEVEQIKNRNKGMPPVEETAKRVSPDDIRPAINVGEGKILVGEKGDTHADILERNGINPDTIVHSDPRRGFVNLKDPQAFLDRRQAESISGLKGTADAGGLDSQDLPGAAMARLERMMAEQDNPKEPNAVRELRTDSISETQSPENLQKVDEKVRQGAEAKGDAQGEAYSGFPLKAVGRDVKDLVDRVFKGTTTGFVNREHASALLDAADNQAKIAGRQGANRIREALPAKVDRQALTFITEAGGSANKLNQFLAKVGDKHPEARAAIERAISQLPRLRPHAEALSRQLESQRQLENTKGVDTGYVANYMKHAYDSEDSGLFDAGHGGQGVSTSFLKPRTFPDYASAIESGARPRTLDAAELLESRVSAGQKLLNRHEWANQLKELKTPEGPFATNLVKRGKQWTAPDGYQVVETAPGVRTAIKDEYVGLVKSLLADSIVSGNWRLLLKGEGILKHGLLIFDTYHMFRMMWSQASLMGKLGYKKGLSVLEYDEPTINRMVKNGDITPEVADWVKAKRPIVQQLLAKGLNVGRLSEAIYDSVIHKALNVKGNDINVLGRSYKWIFEKFTRGAMMETALYEYDRLKALNPDWSEGELAAHVAKQINVNFGNLQRQGIFKSQSARDLLQIAFLAPQWAESMAQKEARGVKQLAEAPFTGKVGTLGKGIAVWTAAAFVANQIINMATRGKPTWDNDEPGHKLDAFIPDVSVSRKGIDIGKRKAGDGFWLSPFSSSAEYTHSFIAGERKGQGPVATAGKIVQNKLSPIGRAVDTAVHGEDYSGRRLTDTERLKEVGKALLPTPLPASGVLNPTPGSEQRQIYSSLGFKVEPAKASERLDQMTLDERVALSKDSKSKEPKTYEGRERGAEKSATSNIRRGREVFDSLSVADRNWLSSRDLLLPGYETKMHYKGVDLPLSDSEQVRMGELVKEEYVKAIASLRKDGRYDDLSEAAKVKLFSEATSHARTTARRLLMQEIVEKDKQKSSSINESNSPSSSRYSTKGIDFRPVQ